MEQKNSDDVQKLVQEIYDKVGVLNDAVARAYSMGLSVRLVLEETSNTRRWKPKVYSVREFTEQGEIK